MRASEKSYDNSESRWNERKRNRPGSTQRDVQICMRSRRGIKSKTKSKRAMNLRFE